MEGREHTGKPDGRKWNPILIAIVSSILGSGGGIFVVLSTPAGQYVAAPDRFTGTEAAALKARINHIESSIDSHVRSHPDLLNKYDRRIASLEAQYTLILQNQQRILDRIDGR